MYRLDGVGGSPFSRRRLADGLFSRGAFAIPQYPSFLCVRLLVLDFRASVFSPNQESQSAIDNLSRAQGA
jgi:hypothetical protein